MMTPFVSYVLLIAVSVQLTGYMNKAFVVASAVGMDLTGWCEYTPHGSVRGYVEGKRVSIDGMMFITNENEAMVPHIDKTVFSEMRPIKKRENRGFGFIHEVATVDILKFFTPRKPEDALVPPVEDTRPREDDYLSPVIDIGSPDWF